MQITKYILATVTGFALTGCVFFDQAQSPPAAQSASKSNIFEVFFDPDHSDISETAAQIVHEAAVAAIQSNATGIKLTVHSTAAGWDADSQALSLRRAEAIKAVLVKDGVLEASITSVDVQRAQIVTPDDGVREPQNRRTEIILN